MEGINVVVAADNNYAQHAAVVIASIMANTKAKEVGFYVLSDAIAEDRKKKIAATADRLGATVNFIELSQVDSFERLFTSGHISRVAYFRLDLARLLPDTVKRVIYTDVDLVFLKDIKELWATDLKTLPLGAVPDLGILSSDRMMEQKHKAIGVVREDGYFNSGVMLIDLEQWRNENYSQQLLDIAAEKQLRHHDQDVLNKFFKKRWQPLELKWNVIPPVFNLYFKLLFNSQYRSLALEARRNMAVMHFAGRVKPWNFPEQSCFNKDYYDYLALTPFAAETKLLAASNDSVEKVLRRFKLADWCSRLLG